MKALVTGGTGFVGRPLVRRLLADGWQVNLITRHPGGAESLSHRHLSLYQGDISDSEVTKRVAQSVGRCDAIFHLAASLEYFGDRKQMLQANVQGTRNVLDMARSAGVGKFIYASSIEAVGPVAKSQVPAPASIRCKPVSVYGRTKALAERLVLNTARGRFPAVALRIGNVYATDHLSFIGEIAQAIAQRNRLLEFLPVYADRFIQPVHNSDVTEGLLSAYRSSVADCALTLAGEYATVGGLFGTCAEVMGRRLALGPKRYADEVYLLLRREYHRRMATSDFITYLMAGRGRRVHRAYSLDETTHFLGYSPQVSLQEGVTEALCRASDGGSASLP